MKSEMVGPERYRFKAEIGERDQKHRLGLASRLAIGASAPAPALTPRPDLPAAEFHGALIAARLLEGADVAGGGMSKVSRTSWPHGSSGLCAACTPSLQPS